MQKPKNDDIVVTSIRIPRKLLAFLSYQSATEQRPQSTIVVDALTTYHAAAKKKNKDTPPI